MLICFLSISEAESGGPEQERHEEQEDLTSADITIEPTSDFRPGGWLDTTVVLRGGQAREGDFICMRADVWSEVGWDAVEHVDTEEQADGPLHLRLSLPMYGGVYFLSYVRCRGLGRDTTYADLSSPLRVNVPLAVHWFCPDDSIASIKAGSAAGCSNLPVRRRSIGTIHGSPPPAPRRDRRLLDILVEDLRSIRSLSITVRPSAAALDQRHLAVRTISRAAVWVFPGDCATISSAQGTCPPEHTSLLVEADMVTKPESGAATTATCYGLVHLPSQYLFRADGCSGAIHGEESDIFLACRFPYSRLSDDAASVTSDSLLAHKCSLPLGLVSAAALPSIGIACSFCKAPVAAIGVIKLSERLPTGLFDHVTTLPIPPKPPILGAILLLTFVAASHVHRSCTI